MASGENVPSIEGQQPPATNRCIHCFPDLEVLYRNAATSLVEIAGIAIEQRSQFLLALSGGSTPRRLFELLAGPDFRDQVDWGCVHWFWSDERAVPPDHPDSNYRMAFELLLQPLSVDQSHIHRMCAEREDLSCAARDYEQDIASTSNVSYGDPPPRFDLILLGMGSDGHTASLFPHTVALNSPNAWVVANDIPQQKTRRMTMTDTLINRAHYVAFIVTGRNKAPRLAEVLEGPPDSDRLPAQLIRPDQGCIRWFLDTAAASRLRGPRG